jgi:ferric-dicitrate binding protein FerR (iron transport regulator)
LEKTVGSRMPGKIAQRIAVAAAVLILFSITGYWVGNRHIFTGRDNQAQVIEFKTPKGQHSELLLPDGTFVSMNFDSKLKYYISREKAIQEVELNGEAFFKVAKNKQRVFRVITENMKVNVLGTEFNVKAYHKDLKTETTLLEGSIEITDIPEEDRSVLLKAGEKWTYNKVEKSQEITTSDSHLASLWRNGEYYFEKITFAELSRVLERMYKVEISFLDPDLEKEVYSGIIYQQDQIDELFRMINLTIPIRVEKKGNSIRISRK